MRGCEECVRRPSSGGDILYLQVFDACLYRVVGLNLSTLLAHSCSQCLQHLPILSHPIHIFSLLIAPSHTRPAHPSSNKPVPPSTAKSLQSHQAQAPKLPSPPSPHPCPPLVRPADLKRCLSTAREATHATARHGHVKFFPFPRRWERDRRVEGEARGGQGKWGIGEGGWWGSRVVVVDGVGIASGGWWSGTWAGKRWMKSFSVDLWISLDSRKHSIKSGWEFAHQYRGKYSTFSLWLKSSIRIINNYLMNIKIHNAYIIPCFPIHPMYAMQAHLSIQYISLQHRSSSLHGYLFVQKSKHG